MDCADLQQRSFLSSLPHRGAVEQCSENLAGEEAHCRIRWSYRPYHSSVQGKRQQS